MKTFDPNYQLLADMYRDDYYPPFLVDKIKVELNKLISLLETGEQDVEVIQDKLDEIVIAINNLQEEFYENESEIETVARDSIGETVEYILKWFGIDIEIEEAIREREWQRKLELITAKDLSSIAHQACVHTGASGHVFVNA